MGNAAIISVEVVHVAADGVFCERVELASGSTVWEAIRRSGFAGRYPGVEISEKSVGVFSRKVGLNYRLAHDDRVEIYRPLRLTPNEVRKLRAERKATASAPGASGSSGKHR
jgi:uncharacterized protein